MRILMTGGSGFLGKHAVNFFLENSKHNLILLVRENSNYSWLENSDLSRIEFVRLDDLDKLEITSSKPYADAILHMATEYGRSNCNISQILESNLALPISLLQFAKRAHIPHFINIDSYFNKVGNSYEYLGDYAKSKKALALWFPSFCSDLRITNIFLEHVYGPGDSPSKFVPTFLRSAYSNFQDGTTFSQGGQVRDFIYVTDVVSALLEIVSENDLQTGVIEINLGTSVGTSLQEFGAVVCRVLGKNSKPPFGSGGYRKNEIMASVADLTGMARFHWTPKYTLDAGIQEIVKSKA